MGDASTSFAEVAEGVRATLAAYTQALDDGRTDEVVATFCPDGAIEIPGLGTHEGHEALWAAYDSWKPRRPQRHLVLNTLVTEYGADQARATSDVIFTVLGDTGWAIALVGRYEDVLHRHGREWRFYRRGADFVQPERRREPR
jgi:SnoaL-like domain